MNTSIKAITAIAILAVAVTSATATSRFYDYDSIGKTLKEYDSSRNSLSDYAGTWEFQVTSPEGQPAPGYNPATEMVTAAQVWLNFSDDSDGYEKAKVSLGIGTWTSPEWEVDPGTMSWSFGSGSAVVAALQDGIMEYDITATMGDFTVNWGKLKVWTEERTQGVPDSGSTLGLLGLTLVGLAHARRKLVA